MSRSPLLDKLLDYYPRWSPTMYKTTLGGALILSIAIPLALVALPFIEFFNGMAAQPKGKAQATYGRTYGEEWLVERVPAEGSIPLGYEAYPYDDLDNTMEAAKQVGEQYENPFPVTMANLGRGRELYNIFCITCHGGRGEGDGPVVGPGRYPAPPSLHTKEALEYKDGTLYHIMAKGIGQMPSYAQQLDPDERWMVAQYIDALQRALAPKPEDLEP
jgi:mono/diheme cytochrome c family protein